MKQLEFFEGREARDAGMAKAAEHAEVVVPGWNDLAFDQFKEFLSNHPGEFMGEDFRAYCAMVDFPLPPHARAFGGVILRAVKAGIISRTGYGKVRNVKAHCANAAIWRAVRRAS